MPTYRYRWSVLDLAQLQKRVPGSLSLGADAPNVYKDVVAPSGSKADLDEFMASQGWIFDSTDPSTTPNEATATNTLARISGFDEGSLLGKRAGINFVGAGVSAADNPGADRIDVTIAGGGATDFRDVIVADHFLTGNVSTNTVGQGNWRANTTGTAAAVDTDVQEGHPGIVQLVAGTSAAARAAINLGETTLGARVLVGAAGGGVGPLYYESLIKMVGAQSILGTSLEQAMIGFGLDWTGDTELADGVYWRFTPGTDSFWTLVAANAGTRTTVVSAVAPAAGVWVRFGMIWTPGATPSVQGLINGSNVGSPITTNLPVAGVGVGFKVRAVATPAAKMDIDYCVLTQVTKKEGA